MTAIARPRGLTYPGRRPVRVKRKSEEEEFLERVRALAGALGWPLQYHTFDSRKSAPGFPDLVLARPPWVLFIELKAATGTLSPRQRAWRYSLSRCPGIEYYEWRPADWPIIVQTLSRRAA